MKKASFIRIAATVGLALTQVGVTQIAPWPAQAVINQAKCSEFSSAALSNMGVGGALSSGGQVFQAVPHVWSDNTVFMSGTLGIVATTLAGGVATEIGLNNIGISTTFASGQYSVSFKFGEYGGNVNLRVNGSLVNFSDFNDIDGSMVGGALVSVINGYGNDSGSVTLNGNVLQVVVSGQELWIDDLCAEAQPDVNLQPVPTKSDLGDAPDSRNHFSPTVNTAYSFPSSVIGRFPTTFDPATAPMSQGQGPKHISIAHAWLGPNVSAEHEADIGFDADGVNNILNAGADVANLDKSDDGWLNQGVSLDNCQSANLVVRVSRSALPLPATLSDFRLNVWIDGDRDGDWKDFVDCPGGVGLPPARASEWIVQNHLIPVTSVPLGGFVIVTIPTGLVPNSALSLTHWLRFSLSEADAQGDSTGNAGGPGGTDPDGRGPANGWRLGETEDVFVEGPQIPPVPVSYPDLGDAPDSTNHWAATNTAYPGPVAGRFPTVWNSGVAGDPSGPKHDNALKLEGFLGLAMTREDEADIGVDADVVHNIMHLGANSANRDVADDGWLNPSVNFPHCGMTTVFVRVSRGPAATLGKMYLNTWIDGNRDGDWEDIVDCPQHPAMPPGRGAEWIVRNHIVNMGAIALGGFQDISVPTQRIMNMAPNQNHWVRFTLSEQPLGLPNGTFNVALLPPRADGRGLAAPGLFSHGETEDHIYKPALAGLPGVLAIDKNLINPHGANTANKLLTYTIDLEHVGGSAWATTTLTDPLPAQLMPVGLPSVTQLNPSGAPLLASLISNTVVWNGSLSPGGKIRITQAVRVKPCIGVNPLIVHNVAYAQQTPVGGGGIISDSVDFDEFCTPKWHWGTDGVTFTVSVSPTAVIPTAKKGYDYYKAQSDSRLGDDYTGPCKPPYLCVEFNFTNNGDTDAVLVMRTNKPIVTKDVADSTERALLRGEEDPPVCPFEGDRVRIPGHGHVTVLKSMLTPGELQQGASMLADLAALTDGNVELLFSFRPAFFDIFVEEVVWIAHQPNGGIGNIDPAACRSVRIKVPIISTDLGDAPDGSNHPAAPMTAYPAVAANYPTVFDPATGVPQGPAHRRPQHFHLGPRASVERDADQFPDADVASTNLRPVPDQKDLDRWDDGVMMPAISFQDCFETKLPVQVFIDPLAKFWMTSTQKTGYLNVWTDSNRDGDWADAFDCAQNAAHPPGMATEHIVINYAVNPASLVLGLNSLSVPTRRVKWPANPAIKDAWMRFTLTTEPISTPLSVTGPGGTTLFSDGRGKGPAYFLGETEDYLYHDPIGHNVADVWVTKEGNQQPIAVSGDAASAGCDDCVAIAYSIIVGNNGPTKTLGAVVIDDIPEGWHVTKVKTPTESTRKEYVGHVSLLKRSSDTNAERLEISLNGLPPGVPLQFMVVMTKYLPPTELPPWLKLAVTNTVIVTASNDLTPDNNAATSVVQVQASSRPPVIIGPGDGTICTGTFTVTGQALAGSTVTLYVDGASAGTTLASGSGAWAKLVSGLPDGSHSMTATASVGVNISPPSVAMLLIVDSALSYSPLSIRFTEPNGVSFRPVDANNRSDDGGWFLSLHPFTVYTIEVRSCCNGDPNAALEVKFGPTDTVTLTDPDGDMLFTGVYTTGNRTTPNTAIMIIVSTCNGIIKDSEGLVLIDPYGVVTNITNGALIQGATVTAFELQGNVMNPWNAAAFSQINPQVTLTDGFYSFFTPPGTYQIAVTAAGFQPHRSLDIVVTNQLVRYDVALSPVIASPPTGRIVLTSDGPDPAVLRIKPGGVVQITNMSSDLIATYDLKWAKITASSSLARANAATFINTGLLDPGASFMLQLNDLGEYSYTDGNNIGTIVVENPKRMFLPTLVR